MNITLHHKDIFKNEEEGILLTVDGAARGMEGNIARRFGREYPDIWEEIDEEINYPIPLGRAQSIKIHPDYSFHNKYCFIASTLNHLDTISDNQKLEVQSSALRHVLSLAEAKRLSNIATTVMVGGWRLEFKAALSSMIETILRAKEISNTAPNVSIYVLSEHEYTESREVLAKYA